MSVGHRVVIVASGRTERRVLPHLLGELKQEGIEVAEEDIRTPPGHAALTLEMAAKLIIAAWFESAFDPEAQPRKFVVLVDTDTRTVEEAIAPMAALAARVPKVSATVVLSACQWHLEAWFFGDASGLRGFLGRDLGSVDTSQPDRIPNPKEHLRNLLLPNVYTAQVACDIASCLSPGSLRASSPTFATFESRVRNGGP